MKPEEIRTTLKDPCLLNLACGLGTLTLVYQLLLNNNQAWGHYLSVIGYGIGFVLGLSSWWRSEQPEAGNENDEFIKWNIKLFDGINAWLMHHPCEWYRLSSYLSAWISTSILILVVGIDVICIPNCWCRSWF